jgi:hypothetical protein
MVIFVPQSDAEDAMYLPEYLDGNFEYSLGCGEIENGCSIDLEFV